MALDQITRAVLDTARSEAEHILRAAQRTADAKVEEARPVAEQEGERRYQAGARAIEEEFARKLVQFDGAANKELLARKNECLQRIFEAARKGILALPENQYAAAMRKLLEGAAGSGGGAIRVAKEERPLFSALLKSFNAGRPAAAQVQLDEAHPLTERGGFILVCEGYLVDQTLQTLLADMEHELAPRIAAEAFRGQ